MATALSSLDIMNLNSEMGHNRQAIYVSLTPRVWVLSRSPGSSELIFPGLLWGTARDTDQNVSGKPKFDHN